MPIIASTGSSPCATPWQAAGIDSGGGGSPAFHSGGCAPSGRKMSPSSGHTCHAVTLSPPRSPKAPDGAVARAPGTRSTRRRRSRTAARRGRSSSGRSGRSASWAAWRSPSPAARRRRSRSRPTLRRRIRRATVPVPPVRESAVGGATPPQAAAGEHHQGAVSSTQGCVADRGNVPTSAWTRITLLALVEPMREWHSPKEFHDSRMEGIFTSECRGEPKCYRRAAGVGRYRPRRWTKAASWRRGSAARPRGSREAMAKSRSSSARTRGAFDAEQGDEGHLAGVLADVLARLLVGGGGVDQVVGDLEGEAEVLGEAGDHLEVAAAGVGGHRAELAGGDEQGAGLVAVDVLEALEVELGPGRCRGRAPGRRSARRCPPRRPGGGPGPRRCSGAAAGAGRPPPPPRRRG